MKTNRLLAALFLSASAFAARADVKLPAVFSDNMVLQQGVSVTVWGWADEGEQVTVEFAGQKVSGTAFRRLPNPLSRWSVKLAPLKASAEPASLIVQGRKRLERKNVLVGEVWLASGQSNMEMALRSTHEPDAAIAAATNALIRLFTVQRVRTNAPADDVKGGPWQVCSPTGAAGFSAVGYYFARDLQKALGVPVGIIHSSWGGTPAEAWTSRGTLESHAELRRDFVDRITQLRSAFAGAVDKFNKETDELKKQGKKQTASPPKAPAMPSWQGAELHNGMIAPIVPFALKGAIWYQGESNASRAAQYRVLFAEMIKGWRREWELGDFPFLAVQLAPYDHGRKRSIEDITPAPTDTDWARLREAQLQVALNTPKTALAVITDAGEPDDIHPKRKEPAGVRLALAARALAYDEKLQWSGPVFKSMAVEGSRALLSFDHVGKGLEARGGKLTGFAVCGDDRKFVWATAEILPDNRIAVTHPDVKKPAAVRYGWADFPVVNLWNKDGLPASPFRTDTFSSPPPTATPAAKATPKK
jgi:sialate O-acetylesterase